jgi:hypothetical protein
MEWQACSVLFLPDRGVPFHCNSGFCNVITCNQLQAKAIGKGNRQRQSAKAIGKGKM